MFSFLVNILRYVFRIELESLLQQELYWLCWSPCKSKEWFLLCSLVLYGFKKRACRNLEGVDMLINLWGEFWCRAIRMLIFTSHPMTHFIKYLLCARHGKSKDESDHFPLGSQPTSHCWTGCSAPQWF